MPIIEFFKDRPTHMVMFPAIIIWVSGFRCPRFIIESANIVSFSSFVVMWIVF